MMKDYFYAGGPLFMSMLTLVLIAGLIVAAFFLVNVKHNSSSKKQQNSGTIKSIGLFALVLGMLGQFIGLFEAFRVIETGMEISPAMLAGGVKVSMITSIYGMIIFLLLYLIAFILKFVHK